MPTLLSKDDLNDFIAPGLACIKEPTKSNSTIEHIELEQEEYEFDNQGQPTSKTTQKTLTKAQISLTDCLACSGCITSMEEVLVAQHSHGEFLKALKNEDNKNKKWILSLSQQARASLAAAYDVSINQMDRALVKIFKLHFQMDYIVSSNLGRDISIKAINDEVEAHKANQKPLLLSVCPGWVLYVEKTHPELIPLMSNVKSPQGITGVLLQTLLGSDIYHLSVMPCFDKKLEAARDDFVDCVLTPKEIVLMMEEQGIDLNGTLSTLTDDDLHTSYTPPGWCAENDYGWGTIAGSSSGGYAYQYILRKQSEHPDAVITTVTGRNNDLMELQLTRDGRVVARAGIVNGFKNIQNLVRKLKDSKPQTSALLARRRRKNESAESPAAAQQPIDLSKCDLLEIMACPQGCINGGGQIKPPEGVSNDEWVSKVHTVYNEETAQGIQSSDWFSSLCADHHLDDSKVIHMTVKAVEKSQDDSMEMFTSTW